MQINPFLLEPIYKPKPWGGRKMAGLFCRELSPGQKIGESWEVCARSADSNIIGSGPLKDKALSEAISEQPAELLGEEVVEKYGSRLPLLSKFIDASEWLSVQVHPDDCWAKELGESDCGKHESWVVVEARPGASLVLGASRELPYEELVELCRQGRHGECLNFVQVEKGDVFSVSPGTIHSIGKGILLYEVSQNSDLTFRLHDWNRDLPGRQLHFREAAGTAICAPPVAPIRPPAGDEPLVELDECSYFRLFEYRGGKEVEIPCDAKFRAVTILEGWISLSASGKTLGLAAGKTVFCPPANGSYRLEGDGKAVLIEPL